MIKKIIGKLISGVALCTILYSPVAAETVNVRQTEVVTENSGVISRTEALVIDNNSDGYFVYETNKDYKLIKLRLQTLPVKVGDIRLGISGQYVNGNTFPAHEEIGLAGRLAGPMGNSFGKVDLRWFPSQESFDSYGCINNKRYFTDILASYNYKNGSAMLRHGIDFKVNENLRIGIEAKFSGPHIKRKYLGGRASISF